MPSATLQVGNAGTAERGSHRRGTVTDNGSLVFKRSDIATVAASIAGSGTLAQTGTGTLVLPATNTYSYAGVTTVAIGVLQIDGTVVSNVTVSGAGMLTGSGTLGALTGNSGGAVTPGDSPAVGTLTCQQCLAQSGRGHGNFDVSIAGQATTYSQANVAVRPDQPQHARRFGVTLNLATVGGYNPMGGDQYIIIANDGSCSPGDRAARFVAGGGNRWK